jgi:hypothetical protein
VRRDGLDHWKNGDIGRALAHLMALRELAPTDEALRAKRQEAILDFSIAAASLGRLLLAREILSDLLCEPPDARLVTRVLLKRRRSGAQRRERRRDGVLREAEVRADRSDVATMAWLHHAQAKAFVVRGGSATPRPGCARRSRGYRRSKDTYGEEGAFASRSDRRSAGGHRLRPPPGAGSAGFFEPSRASGAGRDGARAQREALRSLGKNASAIQALAPPLRSSRE